MHIQTGAEERNEIIKPFFTSFVLEPPDLRLHTAQTPLNKDLDNEKFVTGFSFLS